MRIYEAPEVSDEELAQELGLNYSAKLNFASNDARTGNLDSNVGSVICNAPLVAFKIDARQINFPAGSLTEVHDQVVAIDPYNMTCIGLSC